MAFGRRLIAACVGVVCFGVGLAAWAEQSEEPPARSAQEQGGNGGAEVSEDSGLVVPLDWFIVPIIGYSPDTSVALASISILRFRFSGESEASRPSTAALLVTWTLKNQVYIQVGPSLYFDDEKWFFRFDTVYEDWPEQFFGVGPNTRLSQREELDRRTLFFQSDLRRSVLDNRIYLGLLHKFNSTEIRGVAPEGALARGNLVGSAGGLSSGLGLSLQWDSRDHDVYTREGLFAQVSGFFHRDWMGSDFEYDSFKLDLRGFAQTWDDHTVGIQVIAEAREGQTPFYELAEVGGLHQLRGFLKGRYRDDRKLLVQSEYRFPYIWRVCAVMFAGAGQVQPDAASFNLRDFHVAGGGGLRFAVNEEESINMRADLGVTLDGEIGAYLAFIEAF